MEKGGIFERNTKPRSTEEAEKGEIFETNTKPSSMEEADKGEVLERNTKPSSMEEADKGEVLERNTKLRLDDHPGATAGLFPNDIILEILSRLPVRSVHRFKCVSVPWRDLITDPANRKKLPHTLAGFLYMTVSNNNRINHHFASVYGAAARSTLTCTMTSAGAWSRWTPAMASSSTAATRKTSWTLGEWVISVLRCAIPPLGGGWSCPLNRSRPRTDMYVPQAWLSIRRSHPISTFFTSSRPFGNFTSQQ